MTPWTAQRTGALVGAAMALAIGVWLRVRPKPCPGAVITEFHPPLADAGSYHFHLTLGASKECEFSLALPLATSKPLSPPGCGMALALGTQISGARQAVASLTFAAAPEHFHLQVTRNGETIYDTELEPHYAPYATTRAESAHFCGERARVQPACVRGSSECAPFPADCGSPSDCAPGQLCCATPEWGRDYGPHAATECASQRSCLSHFGHFACKADADCPNDMRCDDHSLAEDFRPSLLACRAH